MRQVKFELTNTTMESANWDFKVNNMSLTEHLSNMLENGKFVGTITVTIKETAPFVEKESENDDENSN